MNEASNKDLHVALLLPSLSIGGAERVTLNLAEGLRELGCQVDLVVFAARGALKSAVPRGVRVVDLRCARALMAPIPLMRYLRQARPEVMISAMGHTNLVAILAHWLAGSLTRLVLSEHTAVAIRPLGFRDRVYRILAKRTYPRATAIIAVSNGVASSLVENLELDSGAVSVIYNPVLTQEFWEKVNTELDNAWFAEGHPPVVLAAGRLAPEKDFATLLRAFAKVVRNRPARLIILGDGPARRGLEETIQSLGLEGCVRMPGFVDNAAAYMAAANVFVLSSVHEGLPTVLIEALGAGVAVVSTDCDSGPREILRDGKLGRLVPIEDSDALATAIVAALDEPLRRASKAELELYAPLVAASQYLQAAGVRG